MKIFQATKTVEFDYGHRVPQHGSKCKNVHGHRGKLEVTVEGTLVTHGSSTDMVMDFGDIKQLVQQEIVALLDHCFLMASNDAEMHNLFTGRRCTIGIDTSLEENSFGYRYMVPGFGIIQELRHGVPTAEVIACACYDILSKKLPCGLRLVRVRFWETPNSVAEYQGEVLKDLIFVGGIAVHAG